MARRRTWLLAVLLASLPLASLRAGGPTVHEAAGERDLASGILEDLTLGEDGVLRPGPVFDTVPLDAASAWAAAADGAGGFWVGTGDEGVLVRVGKDGATQRVSTGGRLVTAVAALPGGGCAAAVVPGGAVLRVAEDGTVSRLASLEAEYVWALAALEDGTVLAATGAPGALLSVAPDGKVTKLADALDEHARSLFVEGPGRYLVGTAGKGLVLRVSEEKPGAGFSTRVLRDLDEGEVVGLAASGKDVLAAVNEAVAGGGIDEVASLLSAMTSPTPVAPGKSGPPPVSLQTGKVRRIEPDGVDSLLWEGQRAGALSMALDGRGGAIVGTGPGGRVVQVDARGARILADLVEPEASVVVADADGLSALVSSNPAVLHRRKEAPRAGRFTSASLDAGTTAAWGRLLLVGRGLADPEVRGGETSEPDATWTDWRALEGFDGTAGQAGLVARRLQVRVRLVGPDAFLRRLEAVAQAGNHAPVVDGVTVARARGTAGAAGQREVAWRASDVDRDSLVSVVEARREGTERWLLVTGPGERTSTAWETAGWPDGVYEVRVTVSDEAANPPGRGRRAVAVSPPVRVDNRAPDVADLRATVEGAALRISGRASDRDGGRIAGVEASVDGGPWTPMGASDAIFDSPEERFGGDVPLPASGGHEVVVRAVDGEGNRGSAALTVETP